MLVADYWLFKPVRDRRIADDALATASIDNYGQERAVFEAWATRLTRSEGVVVVSETPGVRVLRVVDRERLRSAVEALIDGHRWRPVFDAANPKRHWTEQELAAALAASPPSLENIRFGDQIELRALSATRTGMDTTVRIWWKPLPGLREHDWIFFIHSLDDSGNIVLNNQVMLDLGSTSHDTFRLDSVTFPGGPPKESARLGVGFYRSDSSMLAADTGTRDWNGKRVLVSAP